MRTVLRNHDEVCHVWAQQKQAAGRSGNIFFERESIYSYGRHFEMARFIDDETVFITSRGYSVSTAKHLSLVRGAVRHKTVYTVPQFDYHPDNVRYFIEQAKASYDKAKRARTNVSWHINDAKAQVDQARRYMTQFKVDVPAGQRDLWVALHTETYLNGDVQAALLAKEREARKAKLESQKQRRLEQERKEAERLAEWIAGTLAYGHFSAMRLRVYNDEVQTTHGARVPIIEARKLYQALKAGVDVSGQRIGHYTVTRVEGEYIIIGCHTIPLSEIERIAPEVMQTRLEKINAELVASGEQPIGG